MKAVDVGEGICFGIGGTNYRVAECDENGDVNEWHVTPTPDNPRKFFGQTARAILEAADCGAQWAVMGVPGPVTVEVDEDDKVTQNFRVTNIKALSRLKGFDPVKEMSALEPAFERLTRDGFTLLTVNDADLAAHAAAKHYGTDHEGIPRKVIADLVIGTGIGGAEVRRDERLGIYHSDPGLWEVGHSLIAPGLWSRTYEKMFSGAGIGTHCETPAERLEPGDPIWYEVAQGVGMLALNFGLNGGAELMVVSGGTGIHAQANYKDEMQRMLDTFAQSRNPMADKVPEVKFAPRELADTYEMYGARGAVVSHLTQRKIDRLIRAA